MEEIDVAKIGYVNGDSSGSSSDTGFLCTFRRSLLSSIRCCSNCCSRSSLLTNSDLVGHSSFMAEYFWAKTLQRSHPFDGERWEHKSSRPWDQLFPPMANIDGFGPIDLFGSTPVAFAFPLLGSHWTSSSGRGMVPMPFVGPWLGL